MAEAVDDAFLAGVRGAVATGPYAGVDPALASRALVLFDAQVQSRHLDFAARWLQQRGAGYYTIGSAGHEANAALGLITRVDDPALLHYRSGGFYAARAAAYTTEHPRDPRVHPVRDVLRGLVAVTGDPISGGRHKVFGHPALHIIPQTSTVGSHLPRAVGLALALGGLRSEVVRDWPEDAIVVCSFGDASLNHSTAQGALNAAAYLAHRRIGAPVLFVCEDNGLGISTRTPPGWTARVLGALPSVPLFAAEDPRPDRLLVDVGEAVSWVREHRAPATLLLRTVRFMGHAGSDVELAYRSRAEVLADHARDPLLASARFLVGTCMLTPDAVVERYEETRSRVMACAAEVAGEARLADRRAVVSPLGGSTGAASRSAATSARSGRPRSVGAMTLAQAINATLADLLAERPGVVVFGEDVAVKGGVYGVTRGLRRRFGGKRVFDTLLDEQTILGTALGLGLAGFLPIPEIQYLAYLHNAEDQLRGEAASMSFFSDGQYRNPMVVRVAGLAYQKGFGGHFHNDNSVAVLRDIPGLVLCVPSHPADAPALLRECVALAEREGRVCVFLEPIALYHSRDLHEPGDDAWVAEYDAAGDAPLGSVGIHGTGADLLLVTFGNGVPMGLRAARRLEAQGIGASVLDLRWLAPLPRDALVAATRSFGRVLVVDETRQSGGVAEGVLAVLVDAGYRGLIERVASCDSYVPLGPAADHVLLGEEEIIERAVALARRPDPRTPSSDVRRRP